MCSGLSRLRRDQRHQDQLRGLLEMLTQNGRMIFTLSTTPQPQNSLKVRLVAQRRRHVQTAMNVSIRRFTTQPRLQPSTANSILLEQQNLHREYLFGDWQAPRWS